MVNMISVLGHLFGTRQKCTWWACLENAFSLVLLNTDFGFSFTHSRVAWMLQDTDGRKQFDNIYHHVRDIWIDGSNEERDSLCWRQHGFKTVLREKETLITVSTCVCMRVFNMSSDRLSPCCSWTLWDIEWSHVDI